MVISSDFRMGQYSEKDLRENAPYFIILINFWSALLNGPYDDLECTNIKSSLYFLFNCILICDSEYDCNRNGGFWLDADEKIF